jgi:hypothetical protein
LDTEQDTRLKHFGVNFRGERMRRGLNAGTSGQAGWPQRAHIQKIEASRLNVLFTTVWRLRDALSCSWEVLMNIGGSGREGG